MLSGPTQYDSFRFATKSEQIFCILQYTLYLKRRFRSIISANKKYGVRDEFRIFLFYSLIKPAIRKAAEPAHIRQGNRAVSTDVFSGKCSPHIRPAYIKGSIHISRISLTESRAVCH